MLLRAALFRLLRKEPNITPEKRPTNGVAARSHVPAAARVQGFGCVEPGGGVAGSRLVCQKSPVSPIEESYIASKEAY